MVCAVSAGLLMGLALAAGSSTARAEPLRWDFQLSSGAEYDSNIHRFEEGADQDDLIGGAPLLRGALRLDTRWRPSKSQRIGFSGLLGAKLYGPDTFADLDSGGDENVSILSADGRYERSLPGRDAVLSARASIYDTSHLGGEGTSVVEPRHFTIGGGDLGATIVGPEQHRLSASAGYRRFAYQPDERFDWQGDRYGLRFQTTRWIGDPDEDLDAATIDLDVSYALQRRFHGREPDGFRRVDLFHLAVIQAVFTGDRIYSGAYELQVTDSNTPGFSFIRQRLRLGVTSELIAEWFLTVEATVQLDIFLDDVLLDSGFAETIDDENRNALSAHVSRALSPAWTGELRYALYLSQFTDDERQYQRQILYAGLVYQYTP